MVVPALVALLLGAGSAMGEALDQTRTINPILTRPALLDGPGSVKERLREQGVSLDLRWTQFYQGLTQGEGDHEWQYGGKGDIVANFDLTKLFGLWPGLSVNLHQELQYGDDANSQGAGALLPVNTALAFPRLGGHDQDTSIVFTQQFGDRAALSLGKFNMLDPASRRPLVGGGGLNTFQYTGVAAPVSGVTPPYLLGASLSLFTKPVSYSLLVYDPRNAQDSDVISNPFDEGVTYSLTATLPTEVDGLDGSHSLRGVYSTLEGTDLENIPALKLPSEIEDYISTIGTKKGYWYLAYTFHQYFSQNSADPRKGWGLFGEVAVSDGNPNPVKGHWYLGIGGNSSLPGRDDDLWGLVYFDYRLSDDLRDAAQNVFSFDLEAEQGVEAYYNVAVTPWLRVTGNVQVIDPSTADNDTAVFVGLRTEVRF